MRILHLDTGKEMRGGQRQLLRLTDGLAAAGVESAILARAGGPLYTMARERGRQVEPIGLLRLATLAGGYDLVHAHDARSHTLAALARFAPLVVSRRVAFPIGSGWKYGRALRYLAVSQFVKTVLIDGGVPEEKIRVIYDGVPLMEESAGSKVMALANAADPMKGETLATEGAKLAGVPLSLTSDLERDIQQAAIFLYISHSEGLGSAALLAMSAGVPVIGSRTGGLPEIVRHGETGLLVENTPSAIAAAIQELVRDPDRARQYGRAGRETVKQRFTVDHMVSSTIEAYRQVFVD